MDVVEEDDIAADLIRGESEQKTVEGINDPLRYVDRFCVHREQSVRAVVQSAIAVCEGIDAVRGNSVDLGRFLKGLADAKVISKAEADKAELSKMSMISKIRKINEHRDIILHDKVADKICTGYSVLYELGLLIDKLPDDGDAAAQLGRHLETLDGALTRKWVQDLRESIAPKQPRKKKAKVDPADERSPPESTDPVKDQHEHVDTKDEVSGDAAGDVDGNREDAATSDADRFVPAHAKRADVVVADAGEPITAALLIVNNGDEGALLRAAEADRWQRMADQMAEDSAIFVFARLDVLLNIGRIVKTFGPCGCANLYLLSEPDKLEATKCNVLAIFERGDGVFVEGVPNWKASDSPFVIAEQFLLGVSGRRLQFFAEVPVPGWEALTVDRH